MFSRSKGSTVFYNFELHVLRDEKTLLEIWLNPGFNRALEFNFHISLPKLG